MMMLVDDVGNDAMITTLPRLSAHSLLISIHQHPPSPCGSLLLVVAVVGDSMDV